MEFFRFKSQTFNSVFTPVSVFIYIIIILLLFPFQATKLKAVAYPLIGAAVGGVCGGPVGLVVGLKAGAAVALGGGIVGFFGGKYFRKKQDDATDIQLENLSSSREVKKYHWRGVETGDWVHKGE